MTATNPQPSDVFLDAYNLVAKKAEEHPYLATAAAGTAIVGAGLIAHNYGAIARSIGRFTQSSVSEARNAFASLTREGTATTERSLVSSLQLGKANSVAVQADRVIASNSRALGTELKSSSTAERSVDYNFFAGKNLPSDNPLSNAIVHGHDHIQPAFVRDFEKSTDTNTLRILAEEGLSTPKSMSPKAYKVVRDDGTALFDSNAKYPLPRQTADGKFTPGAWVEPGESESVRTIQKAFDGEGAHKGIYITSNPRLWNGGLANHSVYEVEIGDATSLKNWEYAADPLRRIDTVASKVRLLRKVPDNEIAKIPYSASDRMGYGMNNSPSQESIRRLIQHREELEARVLAAFK